MLKPNSPHFTILAANDAYAKATHTTLEILIGHDLLDVFPANPDDLQGHGKMQVYESLEYVVKHSEPHIIPIVRYDVRKLPEEGGGFVEKYWSMVTTPVLNPKGEVEYIIHRVEDITEKKRIKDDRQRFFDEGADMVMVGSFDGYLKHVNPVWEKTLGWTEEELTSKPWLEFVHPEDHEITLKVGQDIVAGKDIPKFENRYRCKDGSYRWLRWKVKPFVEEKRIYGGASDVTDYKRIEAELVKARDNAEAANIAKTEFLSNMSHEIRTPMNAVIGLSTILARTEGLTARQKEYIHTLQLSADSLLGLINDLLDISKIEARSIELEHIPFDITQLLNEVISMMAVRAKEKRLEFAVTGACDAPHVIVGDPMRLRQIILNLCSNAIKFTDKGGVYINIAYDVSDIQGIENLSIAVSDTGIGIAQDKQETIFHKFVQADSSINRKYGGTGLGLAITKTLVEIMGGTIAIESSPAEGAVFTVKLPVMTGDLEKPPYHPAATEEAPEPSAAPQHEHRILLVEDYAANVLVAGSYLELFGYSYDVADNGYEAIEKAKTGNYLAILMDVQMHGINGFETTRLIRMHEKQTGKPATPIIGMTAHALVGDKERCIAAGMDDYLSKPYNPAELKQKLAHCITSEKLDS